MVQLLKKGAWFISLLAVLLAPISCLSKHLYRQALEAPVFHFKSDIDILVAGDSHTQATIDPRYLPHSENIAESAENYFFTYYKLKQFLNRNDQVHLVILGFSWHNFARNYEDAFLLGEETNRVPYYYPLLDPPGRLVVRSRKSGYLVPWAQYTLGLPLQVYDLRLLQHMLSGVVLARDDFAFFGGYQKTPATILDPKQISRKLGVYFTGPSSGGSNVSGYMDDYLDRILAYCTSRNVRVLLINTPVHEVYRQGIPGEMIHHLDSLQGQLKSKYPDLMVVDYSGLKLDRTKFYDGDHVNQYGAEQVTRLLADSGVIQR